MTNPDQYITVTRTRLCGCNNFGELRICDGLFPLLQTYYGDDNTLTLGYHLTFEIESETSAVNPTILVKN